MQEKENTSPDNPVRVIVFGADNYNTLGVLRSLGKCGFDLMLLVNGKKGCAASASKYCHCCVEGGSNDGGVDYLISNYPETDNPRQRPVVIPGGDGASLALARRYDELKNRFHLMITSDPQTIIRVTDKNEMIKIATRAGLNVPPSQFYRVGCTDISVPFPAILKPCRTHGRTEFQARKLKHPSQLYKLNKLLNKDNTYILQKYVQKTNDIIIFGCRLPDGVTVLAGADIIDRWSDDGGGSHGVLVPETPEYIDKEGICRFLDIIDYHGLFSAEFGIEDGVAYFYEFNLRNDGFTHLTSQGGANLPLLWVNAVLNLGLENVPRKMTEPRICINEVYDFTNVLKGRISLKKYKADKKEANAFHFYDPEDPKPYKNMKHRMWWEIPVRAAYRFPRPLIIWIFNKLHM